MPLVKPGVYKYVEKQIAGQNVAGIKLLKPKKWAGFVFTYTGGKFGTPDDMGQVAVHYDYNTLHNPTNITNETMQGEEFTKLLGDIFVDVVEVAMKEKVASK